MVDEVVLIEAVVVADVLEDTLLDEIMLATVALDAVVLVDTAGANKEDGVAEIVVKLELVELLLPDANKLVLLTEPASQFSSFKVIPQI